MLAQQVAAYQATFTHTVGADLNATESAPGSAAAEVSLVVSDTELQTDTDTNDADSDCASAHASASAGEIWNEPFDDI